MFKFIGELVGVDEEKRPWPSMQIVGHRTYHEKSIPQTWVLAHQNGRLYHGIKEGTMSNSQADCTDTSLWRDPETCLPPPELDPANLYPKVLPRYNLFHPHKHVAGDTYKKQGVILKLDRRYLWQALNTTFVAHTTAREIDACQILDSQPHKSICKYYGVKTSSVLRFKYRDETIDVTMDQERVLNLVFEKYDCNLREAIERGYPVHIRDCLQSIAAGTEHMHSLKLVHGDVKPENILVKWSNNAHDAMAMRYVIGDFDSTQWKGSVIGGKYGTPFRSRDKKPGVDIVEEDDDWFGFDQLKKWLVCFTTDSRQKSEDYRGIGKKIGGTDDRENTITYSSVGTI
ncbi:hypothetical protein AG0111_0g11473 [Alternaria gaisen]|uniref:Uncharacterized protein n=1 Tax=Alternaria gaisen TaxID=167740 RepID=A0ACB6F6V4_9PLEO|nr:hypothetical protein AG0111_0g11473 [Alternaria gaisen]